MEIKIPSQYQWNINLYLRTGLDKANGVATPKALIRCCIVGVADVIREPAPGFVF